jgi:hypothetical protein
LTKSQRVHDNVRQVNLILLITTGSRILTISEFREPLVMGFENKKRERERTKELEVPIISRTSKSQWV